ncbi:hypothetical protein Cgig2_009751 [Carnegiea gigantea]|uniref:Reverse transcriptase n=1 Tax=Carnegiea gigantea TaxID=171969 RepID=A0A9Q1JV43_9CARY|nr:hypothetical protein Cgig2_009751 [Carnegiea gigantea]
MALSTNVIIETADAIDVGPEAFKRKQSDDMTSHEATTKNIVLQSRNGLIVSGQIVNGPSYSLYVNFDMSDHLPILLKCKTDKTDMGSRKKHFHFENMWFTDPSCKDIVHQTWSSPTQTDVIESLVSKLESCATALSKWNVETFGHVGRAIRKLEDQLKQDRDAISRRKILGEIREWRNKEQILWWQRARSDYLQYRDANTRWFYTCATTRRAKNTIVGLHDGNGVWRTSHDKLTDITTSYFACVGSLPSSHRISTRVPGFAMSCSVCDHVEDMPTYAVLECPLAIEVWSGSGLDESLWTSTYRTLMDCIVQAMQSLSDDSFGDFLAIMWECWNARNRFIFGTP